MYAKDRIVAELTAICIAVTLVGCSIVAVLSLFSAVILFDSSPGWAALWFVVSIVTGSIASFIWRRIMKRWKR